MSQSQSILTVTLRGVELGSGHPSICVPLLATTAAGLEDAARHLDPADLDLVELRIDHLGALDDPASVREAIRSVREGLPADVPVLFTFRTTREGGQHALDDDGYEALIALAVATGGVDAVDVEMDTPREHLTRIVSNTHAAGVPVVMSWHDFAGTPSVSEMVDRLVTQQELGADVVKLAVTPRSPHDVLALLTATSLFSTDHATRPAITVSMGPLGVVSRISGHTFGSCVTFGMVGSASAPGQLAAHDLRTVLGVLGATAPSAGRRRVARSAATRSAPGGDNSGE